MFFSIATELTLGGLIVATFGLVSSSSTCWMLVVVEFALTSARSASSSLSFSSWPSYDLSAPFHPILPKSSPTLRL